MYIDVVQYEALIEIPKDFFTPQAREKRQESTSSNALDDLIKTVTYITLHNVQRVTNNYISFSDQ